MTTQGSYNASTINHNLDSELRRLHAQVLLSWEKEARTLAWFGLADGMSVLEVGSGPGFFTEQLLALLPHSSVTAVEIDPVLHEKAEQYLHQKASDRLSLVQASIMDTGLPANSFDFVIARLVFCHLPTPVDAALEILRVLKPGGKLVIIDLDNDIFYRTEPPISTPVIKEKISQLMVKRGGNPLSGQQLLRLLATAGFQNLDLEAVVCHSDATGMDAFLPVLDRGPILQLGKLGVLSEQELESFSALHENFLASPNSWVMNLWLMACGEKPQL